MDALPPGSLLVRTWFGDDEAWEQLKIAVATPSEEGFLADVLVIDDRCYAGLGPRALTAMTPQGRGGAIVSFLADELTLTTADWPILAVQVFSGRPEAAPLRVTAAELWSVENNLNLVNMDWQDFQRTVGPDGVFRGF